MIPGLDLVDYSNKILYYFTEKKTMMNAVCVLFSKVAIGGNALMARSAQSLGA